MNKNYLKCCANCKHFKELNPEGYGLCEIIKKTKHCSNGMDCDKFIYYKTKNNDKQKNIL